MNAVEAYDFVFARGIVSTHYFYVQKQSLGDVMKIVFVRTAS